MTVRQLCASTPRPSCYVPTRLTKLRVKGSSTHGTGRSRSEVASVIGPSCAPTRLVRLGLRGLALVPTSPRASHRGQCNALKAPCARRVARETERESGSFRRAIPERRGDERTGRRRPLVVLSSPPPRPLPSVYPLASHACPFCQGATRPRMPANPACATADLARLALSFARCRRRGKPGRRRRPDALVRQPDLYLVLCHPRALPSQLVS